MSKIEDVVYENDPDDSGLLPSCVIYDAREKKVCEKPAPRGILFKSKFDVHAIVDVCNEHFEICNRKLIAMRNQENAKKRRRLHSGLGS